MAPDDDDRPMDPAESLRLIERERAATERRLNPDGRLFMWPWGFAWLIGFTLFFLRFGPDGRVFVDMPAWLPLTTLGLLMLAAGTFTGVAGIRAGRWVKGPSSTQGAMYGISWSIAFTMMATVISRISPFLPEPWVSLLWAGGMVGVTAILHMAGGAVYQDKAMFGLGAVLSVVNVAAIVIGPGWYWLIMAVAGGGGLLLFGWLGRRREPQ